MPKETLLVSGVVERIGLDDSIFTIKFNLNTNEIHYIGLMFTNINLTFVKESINAINLYNSDFYKNLNLESTYAQFDDNVYLHWIGPFTNKSESAIYLNKINLIIDKELL